MNTKECYDHKGNKYATKTEMCRQYNVTPSALSTRLKYGWSLEKALTTPVEDALKNNKAIREEMIGKTAMMNCGVSATVIEYKNSHELTVRLEDGVILKPCTRKEFDDKHLKHPGFKGANKFHGYKCKRITKNESGVWYETTAPDGTSDIMTPQMMMNNPKDE